MLLWSRCYGQGPWTSGQAGSWPGHGRPEWGCLEALPTQHSGGTNGEDGAPARAPARTCVCLVLFSIHGSAGPAFPRAVRPVRPLNAQLSLQIFSSTGLSCGWQGFRLGTSWSVAVFAAQAATMKCRRPAGLKHQKPGLLVLEAGSPRSRSAQGWPLPRPPSPVCGGRLLIATHGHPPACLCPDLLFV